MRWGGWRTVWKPNVSALIGAADRCGPLAEEAASFAAGDLGVAHLTAVDGLCADVGVDQVAAVQADGDLRPGHDVPG